MKNDYNVKPIFNPPKYIEKKKTEESKDTIEALKLAQKLTNDNPKQWHKSAKYRFDSIDWDDIFTLKEQGWKFVGAGIGQPDVYQKGKVRVYFQQLSLYEFTYWIKGIHDESLRREEY